MPPRATGSSIENSFGVSFIAVAMHVNDGARDSVVDAVTGGKAGSILVQCWWQRAERRRWIAKTMQRFSALAAAILASILVAMPVQPW